METEPKDSRDCRPHVGEVVSHLSTFDVAQGIDRRGRVRHSLNCPDWAAVVAVDPDGRLVMVEVHRYATGEASLEVPGGAVDAGEDPQAAAVRELLEETGYEATEVRPLGWVYPNPAIQDNRFHMYLARARRVAEQRVEDRKLVAVRLMTADAVWGAVLDGRMTHALHLLLVERALALLAVP